MSTKTIEQKARAYDEALERARFYHGNCPSEPERKKLEKMFPVLRESEDERIREWLVDYFKEVGKSWIHRGVSSEQVLAYLEKQKEPQYAIRATKGFGDPDGPQFELVDLQKEQKPAEWSEEDENARQNLIAHFEGKVLRLSDKAKKEAVDWLKSLRPSWKPSKDEERLINTSISFLKDFADKGYENAVECIDWLKSKLNGDSGK